MTEKTAQATIKDHPRLQAIFVEAPLEQVISYFRGQAANSKFPEGVRHYEVCGADAHIKQQFGPDTHLVPAFDWIADRYLVRGYQRIATVSSNPKFIIVETYLSYALPYFADTLYQWTDGATVIECSSTEGPAPIVQNQKGFPQFAYPETGFTLFRDGKERSVYSGKVDGRWSFYQRGDILPFENPTYYTERKKAVRLNRGILFEYLTKLDIDPVATLIERRLKDPILFTADHVGQNVDIYEEERLRYDAYTKSFDITF